MKIFQIILISTILGLCCAGDIHRVAGARWNNPQEGQNTVLGLYFTLDTKLPKGGHLVLAKGNAQSIPTSCNVYPIGTTLDPASYTAKTAGVVNGTYSSGTCTLIADLNANTAYAIILPCVATGDTKCLDTTGAFGPFGITTWTYGATEGVMLDQNNGFDMISVLAAPTTGLILTVKQDETDLVNKELKKTLGNAINYNFEFTFASTLKPSTDATAPFYVKAPFNVVINMVQPTITSKLATSQWSWGTTGTCKNYQYGKDAAKKVDNKIVPELALGNLACTALKGKLTIPVTKNDLSIGVAWSKFLLNFRLNLKLPTTYVGSSTPTFKSCLMKNGQHYLTASSDAACATCQIENTAAATVGNSVQLSWGLAQSSKDGVAVYASPYCLEFADVAKDTVAVADAKQPTNCAMAGNTGWTNDKRVGTTPSNSVQFQWKIHQNIPDDTTTVEFECQMGTTANGKYLYINQATAQFHGWGKGNCWYAGQSAAFKQSFKCLDVGKLDKDSIGYLSFQFQLLSGPKDWLAVGQIVKSGYTSLICKAEVKTHAQDIWFTQSTTLLKIDNGDAYKYETFIRARQESSAPILTGAQQAMATTTTATTADFVLTWQAFPKADGIFAPSNTFTGVRQLPIAATSTSGKDLQLSVFGYNAIVTTSGATDITTTHPVANAFKQTAADGETWLSKMAYTADYSNGGYVTWSAGTNYGGTCAYGTGGDAAKCPNDLDKYFISSTAAGIDGYILYNTFQWKTQGLYANPKYLTAFRGRGEFAGGSFSTTNQALNDYFWTVKINGTTAWTDGWMVSTVSHVYLTATPKTLYSVVSDQDVLGTAKVAVSFPVWAYSGTVNDATIAPNLIKISVAVDNPNRFLGFFVPTSQPFMHPAGGNRVQVVGKDVSCWMYGQANGNGALRSLVETVCGVQSNEPNCLSSPVFPFAAPYLAFGTINFMTCDVSAAQTTHNVYIPMKNNEYSDTYNDATLLAISADSAAPNTYTKKAGAASLILFSKQIWDATTVRPAGAAASSQLGFYVLFGASRYLNQITGYAAGFTETVAAGTGVKLLFGEFAAHATSGPISANAIGSESVNYDITRTDNTDATLVAGVKGKYKLAIQSTTQAAAKLGSLVSVCGTSAFMSNLGTVSIDDAAASLCQSFDWSTGTGVNVLPRRCYYCDLTIAIGTQLVYFSAFNPPLYAGKKVQNFYANTVNWDSTGTGSLKVYHVTKATKTNTQLKVLPVTACSGPSTVNKGVKGQTATFSVTTANAVAFGTDVLWIGVDASNVDTQAIQATFGTNSGELSCGKHSQFVTPSVAQKYIKATLSTTDAALLKGSAACGAGVIKLVVRQYTSTNTATDGLKRTTNCFVCKDAATCTGFTTLNQIELESNCYAKGATAKSWSFDQSGTGAATTLTVSDMKHSVDVKGSIGSWSWTPTTGALGLWAGQTTVTYTFGDAALSNSVCQIVGSTAISKCVVTGSAVKLTWGADAGSADFTVRLLNVGAWKPSNYKVQATSSVYNTASILANPLTTAQQSFTAPSAAPTQLTTVALTSSYVNSGDTGSLRFDLTMGVLTSWKKDDTLTVNTPTYYQPRLGGQAACWLWVQQEDPKDKTKTVTVQKEQLYCEHTLDWTLKVWGPQKNEQVKSTKAGSTFKFTVVVTGVQMYIYSTAGTFQVLTEGWVDVATTTKDAAGKDVVTKTLTAMTEYGTVTDGTVNAWAQSTINLQSVVATGTSARATTSLTVKFVTSASAKMDTSNFVGLELPYQWGNVLRGAQGSTAVTTVGAVKLSEWSVVNALPKETNIAVKLDAGSVSGRTLKVCTVPTVSADGKTTTPVVLKKSTNYTLTVASVATPSGASTWGQVRVTVGDKTKGGYGTSFAQTATAIVKNTQFGFGTLSQLGFASSKITVNRGTYSGVVCVQGEKGSLQTDFSVAVVGKVFVLNPAALVGVQGEANACGLLATAPATQDSTFQVGFTLTQTDNKYSKLPKLTVSVSDAKVSVQTASSVNCVAEGSSHPIVFSTASAPLGTLTLELVKKVKAKDAKVEPSLGVTTLGTKYNFGVDKLGGFFYLTCGKTLPASPASKLSYKLDGTAKASYTLTNADLTVNMVKKVKRDDKAKITVVTAASGNTAALTTVTIKCPAAGTAYVQWVPTDQAVASKRWATNADAAAAYTAQVNKGANPGAWKGPQVGRVAVTAKDTATKLTFQSASKRVYSAWGYCLDSSNNYYAQDNATAVTAADNGGAVLTLAYKFDTAGITACSNNAMVLDMCCVLSSGLGRPKNAVVDEFGGWCGSPSHNKPTVCPKPAAAAAKPAAAAANATAAAAAPAAAAGARVLQAAAAAAPAADAATPAKPAVVSKLNLSVQPNPRSVKATTSKDLAASVATLHTKVKDMIAAKKYPVALGAAPTVKVAAAEAKVAWKVKPTGVADFTFVTLSGTTSAAGNVYCFVSKAGAFKPKAVTPTAVKKRILQTADWAEENAPGYNWGLKYNAQRQLTKTTAFSFSLKFEGLTEDKVYKWYCRATSVNPSYSAALYKSEAVFGTLTTKLTPPTTPKTGSDSVIMTSVFTAIVMLITAFYY